MDMKTHNKAEKILFDENEELEYEGGIERFDHDDYVYLDHIEELLEIGLLNSEGQHNDAPTTEVFIQLGHDVNRHVRDGEVQYIGYILHPERQDYESCPMSITGLEVEGILEEDAIEILNKYDADEKTVEEYYARLWWD